MLSFARGVDGQKLVVQVRHLLRDMANIARDTFPKNISIRTDFSSEIAALNGDPTQIHQVLMNLCVNARDAMPKGGLLRLSARNILIDRHYAGLTSEAVPGPYLMIEVEDSGVGIPNALLDRWHER